MTQKAVDDLALKHFTEYFVKNYPGPDTIISRPEWHAPKIFRAAMMAYHDAQSLSAPVAPLETDTPLAAPVDGGRADALEEAAKICDDHAETAKGLRDEEKANLTLRAGFDSNYRAHQMDAAAIRAAKGE